MSPSPTAATNTASPRETRTELRNASAVTATRKNDVERKISDAHQKSASPAACIGTK